MWTLDKPKASLSAAIWALARMAILLNLKSKYYNNMLDCGANKKIGIRNVIFWKNQNIFFLHRLILCNVFFKMTHVLPLISDQNCDKNALQNRRGRPVLNKIGSLTIVFSVFSFAKICQCTQFLAHHIYKRIKDITMNFGSLIENSLIYCMNLF